MSEGKEKSAVPTKVIEGLTLENFKDIMATMIAEMRKPVLTDREKNDLDQLNKERAANAEDVKFKMAQDEAFRKICSHTQDRGRAADKTACSFVDQDFPRQPNGGRYLLCQGCQAKIVPGPAPKEPNPNFIYDSAIFNKHFQMLRFD